MKKAFCVLTSILITTSLLYGCAAKVTSGSKTVKAAADAGASASQTADAPGNGNGKGQGKATDTAAAASESATSIVASEVKSINDSDSYYTAKPVNMSEDNWLTNLAGGRKNAITIRFGQVKDSNMQEAEEYIELDGKGGKVTLVENGGHFEYGGGTLKRVTINFLTGKRLEGKEVVKDYSDGKIKIVLIVDYNEQGIGSPSALFYSQSGSEDKPQNNYYELTTKN